MRIFIILCSWPNIITMIKTTKMRRVEHVACIGEIMNTYLYKSKILVSKYQGGSPLGASRRWFIDPWVI
jgi:hypothetical protein